MLATFALLAAVNQSQEVTFTAPVGPVTQVLRTFSEQTGISLKADPEMEQDIVFIGVKFVSVDDLKGRLADVTEGKWVGDKLMPDMERRQKSKMNDLQAGYEKLNKEIDRLNQTPKLIEKLLAVSEDKEQVKKEVANVESFLRCMNALHPVMLHANDALEFGEDLSLREGEINSSYPVLDWRVLRADVTIAPKLGRRETLEVRIRRQPASESEPLTFAIFSSSGAEVVRWGEWSSRVTCKGFRNDEYTLPGTLGDVAWRFLRAGVEDVTLSQQLDILKKHEPLDLYVGDYLRSFQQWHQVNIIANLADDAVECYWSINDNGEFELDGELEIPGHQVAKKDRWLTVTPELPDMGRRSRADRSKIKRLERLHPSYSLAGTLNWRLDALENPEN